MLVRDFDALFSSIPHSITFYMSSVTFAEGENLV